ncbi:OsmC family protein [Exilibacterium tricleocarpae]|uniref:OsmC family protein n=1 Tax=Exilibacterium tricleocarpae TaxID=2591008 RepID=A0A545TAC5_9GAMM|nr:OsmC family protein [Exilibacterium tricleocarpae]TQV74172.1 OsmC family protein [Exilibacterium tricleocarpae]
MSDVNWTMNERTIVRKTNREGVQETFVSPHLTKVKQGERMQFDAHINVESLPQGQHLKKATIFSNVPNGGTWELISDEGTAVGGRGTAPSPLMYFAAGIGLCLMSHVEMLAQKLDLKIDSVRLEQKTSFTTTLDLGGIHPKHVFGKGEYSEMHLIMESSEKPEKLKLFASWCQQACMALQTVSANTPAPTALYLNNRRIDIEGNPARPEPQERYLSA